MEHHVYFWLKEEHKNADDRAAFEAGLDSLFTIKLVKGGKWSTPAKVMERPVVDQSWDYAISMHFATVADHDTYQDIPIHNVFIGKFNKTWAKVEVKDLA